MATFYESNEEAAELLGLAYKNIGDKDTASELQQQLLLLLSPKRFVFCASQIAAEIAALEKGQETVGIWDAAEAAVDFALQQWVQQREYCLRGGDIAAATLEDRRLLLVELLTDLLSARHATRQVLSHSLSLSRDLQQQLLQQQLQQTVSSLCGSLSVHTPRGASPEQLAEALHAAAAAISKKPPTASAAAADPLLLRTWPAAAAAETAERAGRLRLLCEGLNADYGLRRRVLLIRANVALQAFLLSLKTAEHEEAVCKVLEKIRALEKAEPPAVYLHTPFAARVSLLAKMCATTSRTRIGGDEGPRSWVRSQQLVGSSPPCAGGKPQEIDSRSLRQSIEKANAALRGKSFGSGSSSSRGGASSAHWGSSRGGKGGGRHWGGGQGGGASKGSNAPRGGGPAEDKREPHVSAGYAQQEQQHRGGGHRYRRGGRGGAPSSAGPVRGGAFGGRASDLPPTWNAPRPGF